MLVQNHDFTVCRIFTMFILTDLLTFLQVPQPVHVFNLDIQLCFTFYSFWLKTAPVFCVKSLLFLYCSWRLMCSSQEEENPPELWHVWTGFAFALTEIIQTATQTTWAKEYAMGVTELRAGSEGHFQLMAMNKCLWTWDLVNEECFWV